MFWQSFINWSARDTVSSLLVILRVRHKMTSSLSKCSKVVFLRVLLGLALTYQQTEAEKDLPQGGAVVIANLKCLPSTAETATLT